MKLVNLDKLLTGYKLLLASGSPRRVRLLTEAGYSFRQIIPNINEDLNSGLAPEKTAKLLAEKKLEAIRTKIVENEIALCCDTIVILKGKILGKPSSPGNAFSMLSALAGEKHTVCSAIALGDTVHNMVSGYELTDVFFKMVSEKEIWDYVNSGEPMDKAGAYGIQQRTVFLVDRVKGNIDNVIGLPMRLLDRLAGEIAENMRKFSG